MAAAGEHDSHSVVRHSVRKRTCPRLGKRREATCFCAPLFCTFGTTRGRYDVSPEGDDNRIKAWAVHADL
eukprot:scaffold112936_cov17-Prasinocladus_malaysianus.AAC.1